MKKWLLSLSASTVMMVAVTGAQASTVFVDCDAASANGPAPLATGTALAACGPLATPLGTINSVRLDFKYDAAFGFGPGLIKFTHDALPAALNAFDQNVPMNVTDSTRPFSSFITVAGANTAAVAALGASNNIQLSFMNSAGSVTSVTGDFRWTIDYTVPSTGTPEPATYVFVGAGLIAVGVFRRFVL